MIEAVELPNECPRGADLHGDGNGRGSLGRAEDRALMTQESACRSDRRRRIEERSGTREGFIPGRNRRVAGIGGRHRGLRPGLRIVSRKTRTRGRQTPTDAESYRAARNGTCGAVIDEGSAAQADLNAAALVVPPAEVVRRESIDAPLVVWQERRIGQDHVPVVGIVRLHQTIDVHGRLRLASSAHLRLGDQRYVE